jgi:outer membrane lipoprotein SlyB
VLGGLIAKEVGGKDGQTLATIIGFLGGMWAGHAAEKLYSGQIVYTVSVRMDDGSLRTVEQTTPIAVGAHVSMDGNVLTPVAIPAVAASRSMV